ncbi:MAG: LacI family DNA-binding transcriptional regulator [Lachnospiraceae bacterium]|nr:LacI family DNA-binding transcriptional regulator [Lachnospiraceae bacterium]
MRKNNAAPTMKDVAKDAGVALGTVSKVVNGLPVGEEYRIRVENSIRKLNYQINSYAQGMKSGRTGTVAVLVPHINHPYFASLVQSLNWALAAQSCRMLLFCSDFDPSAEQNCITLAQQNKVDGIIGLTYNPQLQIDDHTPFVSIDRVLSSSIPCVASDNYQGGQLAAEKLAELGCRKVAFLRIGSRLDNEPNKRKAGFENGCLAHQLDYTLKILEDGDSYSEFEAFLEEHMHNGALDFDGLFCVTDGLTYDIIKTLKRLGVKVPDDVQVIGFDGTRYFGDKDLVCSTIVQPVREIAETAVNLLFQNRLTSMPSLVCLPITFAEGGTTKSL